MKKFFYLAFVAIAMMGFTACGDDNEGGSGSSPLVGTQWAYTWSESETEDGYVYEMNYDVTISFEKAASGKILVTGTATVNGTPMGGNLNEEEPFTYTYTGTASAGQGVMTGTDEDGTESSLPFTINGNELIIPFDMFGEDEGGETVFVKK